MTTRVAFPIMGTFGSIVVADSTAQRLGAAAVEAALDAARACLDGLEQRFSHYRVDSDINLWSAGHEVSTEAAADIVHVLERCGALHADSEGVFRAKNPRTGALDTAGYVKGYAISRAVEVLRAHGLDSFILGIGGDAYCAGSESDLPWRVAIQDPRRRFAVLALVDACNQAVATSGTAERGDHIWNRAAAGDLASFTVVGPEIAEADAYATVGFAMGEAGMAWVARHEGYRSIVVRRDGSVLTDAALVSAV